MPKILILDFGSQTTHLIGRRVRDLGFDFQIIDGTSPFSLIQKANPDTLILSGGPASVYTKGAPLPDIRIFSLDIPILGICYGLQAIVHLLGGKIEKQSPAEFGPRQITVDNNSSLFRHLPPSFSVWMSHGDQTVRLPRRFKTIASTDSVPQAAIFHQKIFGIQFHPEVVHTKYGKEILQNFLTVDKNPLIAREKIKSLREAIGPHKAILALSGGVDSSVAAILTSKAIGKNLTCLYVDTGLMRAQETQEIKKTFVKLPLTLRVIPAKSYFLSRLRHVSSPELKRKIIGKAFIKVLEKEARKIKGVKYLIQGTIYPDVIESQGTKNSAKIKTHHNVGGLPRKLKFKLIEPLRDLYKDEVRELGRYLGLPSFIVNRQVFPGPGLAVRIMGTITPQKLKILRQADQIVRQEITLAGLNDVLWMAFAIYTGIKTTGVVGDQRLYGETIAIRALTSIDTMTADWAKIPYPVLEKISSRITNEIRSVCRVVYDITTKPPGTMEWE